MFQDHVSSSVPNFECVQSLRESQIPLLLASHVWDRLRIVTTLEGLANDPVRLGAFYEEFFSESWDEAGTAMLEACKFVQSGLERLSSDRCWLLIFVS
jgi:hypothetical protein